MAGINITNHPLAAVNYFYLNDNLYRIMQAVKASDYLTAWNYHEHGMEEFLYSDVSKRAEPAFRTRQVGEMINREHFTVRIAYQTGEFPRPKKTYPIGDGRNTPVLYSPVMWSKADVYRAHEYFMEKHRVDEKRITGMGEAGPKKSWSLPSRAELRATLEHGTVYYVKDKQGNMVKVWKAENL